MSQVPPPTVGYQTPPPGAGKPQTLAIISLVLGIASFVLCWIPIGPISLGFLLAIGAVVVGVMARGAIKRGEQTGNGLATAGIVIGALHLLIAIVLLILVLVFGVGIAWLGRAAEEAAQQQNQGVEPVELLRFSLQYVTTAIQLLISR